MKLSRRSETKLVEPQPDAPPPPPPAIVDGNGHGAAAAHVPVAVAVPATRAPGARAPMIGELLIQDGAASADQVKNALRQQRKDRRPLGQLLMQLGVPSASVTTAVGWQLGLAPVDLDSIYVQPEAIDTLTALFVRQREVVPYGIDDEGRLHVATSRPGDPALAKEVAEAAQRDVQMELADIAGIRRQLDLHYTVLSGVDTHARKAISDATVTTPRGTDLAGLSADAPVVQIVDLILTQGLRDRVSDIHIEPQADRLRVRFRIDGALRDVQSLPTALGSPVASRLKIMADMDIVDRHRAQDGQTTITVDGRIVDIRIATTETIWGEKVVMRLLDRSRSLLPLEQLGLRDEEHERLRRLIASPYGLFIVSGPTGAGKTTTLYAGLNELDRTTRNITTIEDPVEYQFENINQIQINRLAGMTFANGLRAILRQDPDVILIGEIRDVETAQIAVQSALTGHLVMASLHAADAVGALYRFLDMGLESYLVASAVVGVVAQRLVRINCTTCSTQVQARPEEVEFYRGIRGGHAGVKQMSGNGCRQCSNTGFYDRRGVFECLAVDDEIRELIVDRVHQTQLRERVRATGMRTLQDAVCDMIDEGQTTIAEAMRTVYVI